MKEAPKGLRRHIGLLGRRNAGKSSLINAVAGQNVAIVSDRPGTTTDPVEKVMEINGLGPVVLVDTAGIDDCGELGEMRNARSREILRRMDMAILVYEDGKWGEPEETLLAQLKKWNVPFIVARNKADLEKGQYSHPVGINPELLVSVSAKNRVGIPDLMKLLIKHAPDDEQEGRPLLHDLLPENGLAALVAPLDTGAPRGRLILPQVQAIRDCLDGGNICVTLTEAQYKSGLAKLKSLPDLVVCDSQVVKRVVEETPPDVPLTTFSILMARLKGNLTELARGAAALTRLAPGDAIMIQEACSHHPQKDDIGRVKIPRLLQKMAGGELDIVFSAGKEFYEYDRRLKAIVHCGACVITRKQMNARQFAARESSVPMTNYGVAISLAQGVLPRALALFPEALRAFEDGLAAG